MANLPDDQIDTSDIPELSDDWFKNAIHVPVATSNGSRNWFDRVEEARRKRKQAISLRIDSEIYSWFKRQGPRYQSRINAVLKAYMEAHCK